MGNKNKHEVTAQRIPLPEAFEALIDRTSKHGNPNTAANYRSALNKLKVYLTEKTRDGNTCKSEGESPDGSTCSGIPAKPETTAPTETMETFALQDITSEWVGDFATWLEKKHPGKLQTADFYFRIVRALYNKACREHRFDPPGGLNPFRNVFFKKTPAMKRAIAAEQVRKLTDTSFRERVPELLRECLDVLLFILYMRGMVFQDVYCLMWDMVTGDNHVRYLRNKTGMPIVTEIPPEARRIMERYREAGCSYVFPFLHRSKRGKVNPKEKSDPKGKIYLKEGTVGKHLCEKSALHRINQQALQIGKLAGLPIPLTTYVMRHTFATLMLEGGKSIEIISQCLGHTSIRTTLYYLSQISVTKVDKEVSDMFDQMLRPEKESKKESGKKRATKTGTTKKKNKEIKKESIPENAAGKKENEPKKELVKPALKPTEEKTEAIMPKEVGSFPCEKGIQTISVFPCEKDTKPAKLLPHMALYGTKIKHLFYMAIVLFHF